MYFKDKTEICKVRITPDQKDYINKMAENFNVSKSEIFRIIIDSFRSRGAKNENE